MKAAGGINREAWLAAIRDAQAAPVVDEDPNVITATEFSALIGKCRWSARNILEALVLADRASRALTKRRRVDGVVVSYPAYRLKEGIRGRPHVATHATVAKHTRRRRHQGR